LSVDVISAEALRRVTENTLKVMKANEKYLTDLDAEIGDADHGINMVRGFGLVNDRVSSLNSPDVGKILETAGIALMEAVGGAAGPLYGMLFIKASAIVRGKTEINKRDLAALFEAGLIGVQTIGGGTVPGEKTMVDTLYSVVEALKELADDESATLMMALEKAAEAAREGMKRTISLIAKRGRASYLGERSRGHQDPGATSAYLILRTILDTLNGKVGLKVKNSGPDGVILEETYI